MISNATAPAGNAVERFVQFKRLAEDYWHAEREIRDLGGTAGALAKAAAIRDQLGLLTPAVEDAAAALGIEYVIEMRDSVLSPRPSGARNYFHDVYDRENPWVLGQPKILDFLNRCIGRAMGGHSKSHAASGRLNGGEKVTIGHGRSLVWRELKDFVRDKLNLKPDEYNVVATAGLSRKDRLQQMLDDSALALLVLTGEDEMADGTIHARENVVHEVGLFQGRLGFAKAIVVLEDGCEQFSNIDGLDQIRFPKGKIAACFEQIRDIVKREGLLSG